MSEYKVLFHIDEINKWKLLLTNVGNLIAGMDDENICIEVVANAAAVQYYDRNQDRDTDVDMIVVLAEKGVKFVACNNALKGFDIEKENLISFVEVVPSGIVEIVKRQSEGFSYIKP